jgi:hypothetical protein
VDTGAVHDQNRRIVPEIRSENVHSAGAAVACASAAETICTLQLRWVCPRLSRMGFQLLCWSSVRIWRWRRDLNHLQLLGQLAEITVSCERYHGSSVRLRMCDQIRIPESREFGGKQPNVRTRHGCKCREPYKRAANPRGVQEVI